MRQIIDQIPPHTFCKIWLSGGYRMEVWLDSKPTSSGVAGWNAHFYERSANGNPDPVNHIAVSGPAIIAIRTKQRFD